ncbi:MAG: DUF721 domain-containing protein [Planctomycetes bacterium]|nr:DUF721 domain-containing protein [Planctomycetota bacterium]
MATGWLARQSPNRANRLAELRNLIERYVDAAFRRYCSLGRFERGVLTVLVDDEALTQAMRIRWVMPLQELLARECKSFHVANIRFAVGRSEVGFQDGLPENTGPTAAGGRLEPYLAEGNDEGRNRNL